MAQFPLTPKGVSDKITTLYALSDTELAIQAYAVQTDFRSWVSSAFILNTMQQQYLADLNDDAIVYYGRNCAFCFINRLQIILIYPDSPGPGPSKWIVTENTITTSSDSVGHIVVSGSFTFTMAYR